MLAFRQRRAAPARVVAGGAAVAVGARRRLQRRRQLSISDEDGSVGRGRQCCVVAPLGGERSGGARLQQPRERWRRQWGWGSAAAEAPSATAVKAADQCKDRQNWGAATPAGAAKAGRAVKTHALPARMQVARTAHGAFPPSSCVSTRAAARFPFPTPFILPIPLADPPRGGCRRARRRRRFGSDHRRYSKHSLPHIAAVAHPSAPADQGWTDAGGAALGRPLGGDGGGGRLTGGAAATPESSDGAAGARGLGWSGLCLSPLRPGCRPRQVLPLPLCRAIDSFTRIPVEAPSRPVEARRPIEWLFRWAFQARRDPHRMAILDGAPVRRPPTARWAFVSLRPPSGG